MDKVDYYFENYRKAKRELEVAKDLLSHYKPISEDAFLYSLSVQQNMTEERVQTTARHDKSENIALTYQEKYKAEEEEYRQSLYHKYCTLKAELDFFERSLYFLDELHKDVVIDLVVNGLSWDEIILNHNISRMTVTRYRKKALKQIKDYYRMAGKDLSIT